MTAPSSDRPAVGLPAGGSVPLAAGVPQPAVSLPPVVDPGVTGPVTAAQPVAAQPAAASPVAAPPAGEVVAAEDSPEPVGRTRRPGRGRRLAALVAVLLVPLGLAALVASLYSRSSDASQVAGYYAPSSAPLNAARTAGKVLFSYDYRHLDQDFRSGAALSTGTFRQQYAKTTSAVVRDVAVRYKAIVQADAIVAGVSDAEPGKVTAVVFVNQTTTSTKVSGQKIDQSRVRMVLLERGGRWLVSRVEAV